MRKWMAWMMVAALLCTGCSARNADYYEQAQLYLGGGDYETAAYLCEQLGEYHVRFNLACQHDRVRLAVKQLANAINA